MGQERACSLLARVPSLFVLRQKRMGVGSEFRVMLEEELVRRVRIDLEVPE